MATFAFVALISSGQASTSSDAAVANRNVYVLGDSYLVLMRKQGFDASLPGWRMTSAARGGRNVAYPDPAPAGIQEAIKDRAVIAKAGTVVIELGTNLRDG